MSTPLSEYGHYVKGEKQFERWVWRPRNATSNLKARHFMTVLGLDRKAEWVEGKDGKRRPVQPAGTLYHGPLYFDVDVSLKQRLGLDRAIEDTNGILTGLLTRGVRPDDIRVWATGGKGFHILVPQSVMVDPTGHPKLPAIYKEIAYTLASKFSLVDMTVYSARRGRMWRLPGRKRENGRYKVPVTLAEMAEMTPELYDELTSSPREEFPEPAGARSEYMSRIWDMAVKKVEARVEPKPVFIDPESQQLMADQPNGLPPCANCLLAAKCRDGAGFNAVSIQMGKAVASWAPGQEELVEQFAANMKGEQRYLTESSRLDHTMGVYRRAMSEPGYDWSCRSMLSVLPANSDVCEECPAVHLLYEEEQGDVDIEVRPDDGPLGGSTGPTGPTRTGITNRREDPEVSDENEEAETSGHPEPVHPQPASGTTEKTQEEDAQPEEGTRQGSGDPEAGTAPKGRFSEIKDPEKGYTDRGTGEGGLIRDGDAYYKDGGKVPEAISNFALYIDRIYLERVDVLDEERRTAVRANVRSQGKVVGSVIFEEESWAGKSQFIKTFSGIGNVAFFGSDRDVQYIKDLVLHYLSDWENLPKGVNTVKRTRTVGIHYERISGQDVFTYVEPSWSIDNFGNENTYSLPGKAIPNMELRRAPAMDPEAARDIFQNVLKLNEPLVVAHQFGYYMACFLKTHLINIRREFPLLGVHGNRGSGKTQGNLRMVAALHGVDYFGAESEVNLPNTTPYPVWSAMAGSTTVPVILDEYNKSKFSPPQRYVQYGEYMKMAWQVGQVLRGGLSKNDGRGASDTGAESRSYPVTAPLTVLSEQSVEMPALVQRMVQISVKPQGLEGEARAAFRKLGQLKEQSRALAKEINLATIGISLEQVNEWLETAYTQVSLDMGDRPHLAYSILLVGYQFSKYIVEKLKIPDVVEAIEAAEAVLKDFLRNSGHSLTELKGRTETDLVLDAMSQLAAMQSDETAPMKLVHGTHYLLDGRWLYLDVMTAQSVYVRFARTMLGTQPAIESISQMIELLQHESYTVSPRVRVPEFAGGRQVVQLDISTMRQKGIETEGFLVHD